MTDIPTKWAYIADQLKKHNAPEEIIDAALFVGASLGHNNLLGPTTGWLEYERKEFLQLDSLSRLVLQRRTCTGCNVYHNNCRKCPLGTFIGFSDVRCTACLSEVFTVSNWLEEQINP